MSTIMTGILRMPDELYWDEKPLYRSQHNENRFAAADELERLQTELDETKRKAAEEYAEMSKLLAGFEHDALRYRWLRQQHWSTGKMCVVLNPEDSLEIGCLTASVENLDNRIDLEMEHESGKTKA